MHQGVSNSFNPFVFIIRERTKDSIVPDSALLQDLILEAGKGGGCKVFPSFKISKNSSLYKRCYRRDVLRDV